MTDRPSPSAASILAALTTTRDNDQAQRFARLLSVRGPR